MHAAGAKPPGAAEPARIARGAAGHLVGLAKLDLVTREEFEVQRAVLLKTREKLDALETAVRELEGRGTSE